MKKVKYKKLYFNSKGYSSPLVSCSASKLFVYFVILSSLKDITWKLAAIYKMIYFDNEGFWSPPLTKTVAVEAIMQMTWRWQWKTFHIIVHIF